MFSGRGVSETARACWFAGPLWDGLLAVGAFAGWELRFGHLGPYFNSDVAVHGAMVLRPIDQHFFYYWGQSRLGSLVPMLGKLLKLVSSLSAAEATQLAVYLCSAFGLWLMLGLVRSLPGKALLAVFCAFPSRNLAEILLSPGEPLPGLLVFGAWQLRLFLRFGREPNRAGGLWLGFASAAFYWAGEPALFLFVTEACVLAASRGQKWLAPSRWVPVGAVPFVLVIVVGKRATRSPPLFHLQDFSDAAYSLQHLAEPLATLWPLVGLATYAALILLAIAGIAAMVRGFGSGEPPSAFAVLAPVPLLASWATAVTKWYLLNERLPRYFTFAVVLAVWACALGLDRMLGKLSPWARWLAFAPVLAVTVWMAVVDERGNDAWLSTIPNWKASARWAESNGCQGVIGDYWHSYPFFTLSEGRVLATPYQGQYVRNQQLANETARVSVLCVVPWWDGACKPALEQFGARRVWRDEIDGNPGGEPLRLCRYDPG